MAASQLCKDALVKFPKTMDDIVISRRPVGKGSNNCVYLVKRGSERLALRVPRLTRKK